MPRFASNNIVVIDKRVKAGPWPLVGLGYEMSTAGIVNG